MTQVWNTPLTPLAFLRRSAEVFPDKTAVVYGDRRISYRQLAAETTRVAHALHGSGIGRGDRVAYLLPNLPEMLVAHFAVPLAGAVLVAINTRLSRDEVRYILDHSGAKLLVVDAALYPTVAPVASALKTVEEIITVVDPASPGDGTGSGITYDDLLARGRDDALAWEVADENSPISINYTSGTTGKPKGVQYSHRGAYLNSFGEVVHSGHTFDSVYLWTLPMFHCNGWCTPWAVTAIGGTHVCLREVRGDVIWRLIGAPTVVTTILRADDAAQLDYQLTITTAGAPPSPTTILGMERMGFRIVHVYGLTETYGPYSVNQYQRAWDDLAPEERAAKQARQGVGMVCADKLRVVDERMNDVPADGTTMGEVLMRGNNVMLGYFDDPFRRPRRVASRQRHRAARPRQGRDHLRRGEHLDDRGRAGRRVPPRGAGGGRHRCPGRTVGRASEGVRRARGGADRHSGGADRARQGPDRAVQGAEGGRTGGAAAEDVHGQGAEVRAA